MWSAPGTTNVDRQAVARCPVDRVVVHVKQQSEYVDAAIHWAGGYVSHHEIVRPVRTYEQLSGINQLMDRLVELRKGGHTAARIAETLNAEGFLPPMREGVFSKELVRQLMARRGLGDERKEVDILGPSKWWLKDLAAALNTSRAKLRDWAERGWLHSRTSPAQGLYIVGSDRSELQRLQELVAQSGRGVVRYPKALTTPKKRNAKKG